MGVSVATASADFGRIVATRQHAGLQKTLQNVVAERTTDGPTKEPQKTMSVATKATRSRCAPGGAASNDGQLNPRGPFLVQQ